VIGFNYLAEIPTVGSCLYGSTEREPLYEILVVAEGRVTGLRADEGHPIPKVGGGILCPTNISLIGTAAVTRPGGSETIVVRLVV
jgi:hypothetical protein